MGCNNSNLKEETKQLDSFESDGDNVKHSLP